MFTQIVINWPSKANFITVLSRRFVFQLAEHCVAAQPHKLYSIRHMSAVIPKLSSLDCKIWCVCLFSALCHGICEQCSRQRIDVVLAAVV